VGLWVDIHCFAKTLSEVHGIPVIDFEVQRCTRRCHATDRELLPGEFVFSALVKQGAQIVRRDWSPLAWTGPTLEMVSWWKTKLPEASAKRPALAPGEVMLELFESLEAASDQADFRYVLALLLVRRKVLKVDGDAAASEADGLLCVHAPKTEQHWRVPVVMPSKVRAAAIQAEIGRLLYTNIPNASAPANPAQGNDA
jgi:hypothetical protein